MSASIDRADRLEFEVFARVCDLHPEMVDRFVHLGLIEARIDTDGRVWFDRGQVAIVGRIRRLRTGLRLSYSAISVVAPLIDRIDELEDEVRRLQSQSAPSRQRPQE